MTRRKRRYLGHRWRSVYLWHRYLGLGLAVFVALLAVSGIALNHSHALGLDSRYVGSDWLLDRYAISAPRQTIGFAAAGHWISQVEDIVFFDDRELVRDSGRLVGAVALDDAMVVALANRILLLTGDGAVVESITDLAGAPLEVQAIGRAGTELIVRTATGDFAADAALLAWQTLEPPATVKWSHRTAVPAALAAGIASRYRGSVLSYERVLMDVHSGRILGGWGVYLVDAVAVSFMVLALLGIWTWAARRHRNPH
jgi:hypothetical protein